MTSFRSTNCSLASSPPAEGVAAAPPAISERPSGSGTNRRCFGPPELAIRRRTQGDADAPPAISERPSGSGTNRRCFGPPELAIRRRTQGDADALLELFNEERFQHFGAAIEPFCSTGDLLAWLDSLGAGNFDIVGELDGGVAGYARLQPFSDRQNHSGWIFLGVREAQQRRGVGSALLRSLLATADILAGLQRIQLTVFSDNEVAIRLYRSFGFKIEGRHRRFLRRGDDFVDAFTMARIREDAAVATSKEEALQRIQALLEI